MSSSQVQTIIEKSAEAAVQRATAVVTLLLPCFGEISERTLAHEFHARDEVTKLVLAGAQSLPDFALKNVLADVYMGMQYVEEFSGPTWEFQSVRRTFDYGGKDIEEVLDLHLKTAERVAEHLPKSISAWDALEKEVSPNLVDYVLILARVLYQKGEHLRKTLRERSKGHSNAEGYKKALQLAKLCPIFVVVENERPGVYGVTKENEGMWRGQARTYIDELCKDRQNLVRLEACLDNVAYSFWLEHQQSKRHRRSSSPSRSAAKDEGHSSGGGWHKPQSENPAHRYYGANLLDLLPGARHSESLHSQAAPPSLLKKGLSREDTPFPERALGHSLRLTATRHREAVLSGLLSLRARKVYGMSSAAAAEW